MREPAFLKKNKSRWQDYEQKIDQGYDNQNPDEIAKMYVQLTDDLAYARTFYAKSPVVKYLNHLAALLHLSIFKEKKVSKNRLIDFWIKELPRIYKKSAYHILYALSFFLVAFGIGFLSAIQDPSFVSLIMGKEYVEMTLNNIESGDPLGVYGSMDSFPMFLKIAFNNILVSFMAFVMGVFFSLGTIWSLFNNGVMVGAFLALFLNQALLQEALPIIFIHGTLELSAIVIAGAAGLRLGNAILFPGTFTRLQSVRIAANNGMKMIIGLMPIFLFSAFLESYITRFTEMPLIFKLLIIILSLAFVLGYYAIFPHLEEIKKRFQAI